MSILQRLKHWRIDLQQKKKYSYVLGESVHLKSTDSAAQENRDSKNQNTDSPAVSLPNDQNIDNLYQWWLLLAPREKDVVALTCLGYTNRQIAFRLKISEGTVKSYIQNVLYKLDLHSKTDIRLIFFNWDFSAWK